MSNWFIWGVILVLLFGIGKGCLNLSEREEECSKRGGVFVKGYSGMHCIEVRPK